MFLNTCTVYHKAASGDVDTWNPSVINGCSLLTAQGISPTSQSTASAPASTLIVPAGHWPEGTAPGDYVVPGKCSQEAFTGSAPKTLLPFGGMRIETITGYCFGSPMDHYEVVVR